MSVSNTVVKQVYPCNGVTTSFAIPFAWLITSQIKVYKVTNATGERVPLAHVTDYTYAPNDIAPTSIVTTSAFANTFSVELIRETSLTQLVDYINNGAFLAEDHEAALDKIVMMIQELGESQAAAILLNALDIAAGFDRTLPASVSLGILRANAAQDAMEFKTIEEIMNEAGFSAQIAQAAADAAQAAADAAAALVSANNAEASAAAAEADAQAAADSAAAAIGASVSNRIQVTPYAPSFMGAIVEEEYGQEVFKFGLENKILMFVKMSQYMIAGRPIKLGFSGYSPTADNTSKHRFQITFTLIREGLPVTDTTYQDSIIAETNLINIVDNFTSFNLQLTSDGTIVGEDVQPEDAISIEIKRVDASSDEDPELVRLHKQTFELSFA